MRGLAHLPPIAAPDHSIADIPLDHLPLRLESLQRFLLAALGLRNLRQIALLVEEEIEANDGLVRVGELNKVVVDYVFKAARIHAFAMEVWQMIEAIEFFESFDPRLKPEYPAVQLLRINLSVLVLQDASVYPLADLLEIVLLLDHSFQDLVRQRCVESDVRDLQDLVRLVDEDHAWCCRSRSSRKLMRGRRRYLFSHLVEYVFGQLLAVGNQIVEEAAADSSEL